MIAYQYNDDKKYVGEIDCQLDQLETEISGEEVWLLPANSTFKEPLPEKEGFNVCYNENSAVWEYVAIPQPTIEEKQAQVRAVRESYFGIYVDRYQSKPLLWEEMSEEDKQDISDYRKYLMDYTEEEDWWEHNPMTFEEWKNANLA